jgi:hypothetical protein
MDKSFCFFFQKEVLSSSCCVSLKATWSKCSVEVAGRRLTPYVRIHQTNGNGDQIGYPDEPFTNNLN